jgi:hypothetical protein
VCWSTTITTWWTGSSKLLGDPVRAELGAKAQAAVVNSLGSKALPPCSPCWNPCMPALL